MLAAPASTEATGSEPFPACAAVAAAGSLAGAMPASSSLLVLREIDGVGGELLALAASVLATLRAARGIQRADGMLVEVD